MSLNYHQSYVVLSLSPGCTWPEARERYRLLAKQWHPDHFQTEAERHTAEEKIKSINNAFHLLAQYYRRHNSLPLDIGDIDKPSAVNTAAPSTAPASEVVSTPASTLPATKTGHRLPVRYVAALALFAAAVVVWQVPPEATPTTLPVAQSPEPERTVVPKPNDIFFTVGSTLGEVHAIQGIPTRINDDVWYYGDAKVQFREGLVESWEDSPESAPLKARLDVQIKSRAHNFGIGSSKADVLAIQGKPMHMNDNVWDYGVSRIYFRGDYVSSWDNSPLNPLKAR